MLIGPLGMEVTTRIQGPDPLVKTERIVTPTGIRGNTVRGVRAELKAAMRKRMEITVERDELSVIKRPVHQELTWCAQCEKRVPMISPDEAVAVAGRSAREIYRWVEAGRIHFTETPQGLLSICLKSLY